jgi:two-component system response regulator BasR
MGTIMAETRVLVVDDDPEIRDLLRDALSGDGYAVDCAGDAAAALAFIRERIYAVALVDFDLPDMNGVMLHRKMREMDPELAAATLFMSGMAQQEEHLDYYNDSSGGFFPKPFGVPEMVAAVRRLARPR